MTERRETGGGLKRLLIKATHRPVPGRVRPTARRLSEALTLSLQHVMEIAIWETVRTVCLNLLLPPAATNSQRFDFQNLSIGWDASET